MEQLIGAPSSRSTVGRRFSTIKYSNHFNVFLFISPGEPSRYGNVVAVAPPLFARLLYANPVCLLTTSSSDNVTSHPRFNVMTISWLTPTTNSDGGVILSMNASRFSATLLKSSRRFGTFLPRRSFLLGISSVFL